MGDAIAAEPAVPSDDGGFLSLRDGAQLLPSPSRDFDRPRGRRVRDRPARERCTTSTPMTSTTRSRAREPPMASPGVVHVRPSGNRRDPRVRRPFVIESLRPKRRLRPRRNVRHRGPAELTHRPCRSRSPDHCECELRTPSRRGTRRRFHPSHGWTPSPADIDGSDATVRTRASLRPARS